MPTFQREVSLLDLVRFIATNTIHYSSKQLETDNGVGEKEKGRSHVICEFLPKEEVAEQSDCVIMHIDVHVS